VESLYGFYVMPKTALYCSASKGGLISPKLNFPLKEVLLAMCPIRHSPSPSTSLKGYH